MERSRWKFATPRWTVDNRGTVFSTGTSGSAVYLHGGGSVTNTRNGSVVGVIAGNGTAIGARGGAATVTNSGSIVSAADPGIYLRAGGIVTNAAGGLVAGAISGIYGRELPLTIVNAGTVETTGTLNGVYIRSGGNLTNQLHAIIDG
jgi:hypothetical protein